jgi:muconolactone D-isomerase
VGCHCVWVLVVFVFFSPSPPAAAGRLAYRGRFRADGPDELEAMLASMPLRVWRHDTVTPLSPHLSDPGQSAR